MFIPAIHSSTISIIVSVIAFCGVALSIRQQSKNNERQLRSSHAVKIADMRQAWIDDLRDSMSKFQSYGVTPSLDQESERRFHEYGTRIELLMNAMDADFKELHDVMYRYLEAKTFPEKFAVNPEYVAICQRILKREWDILKDQMDEAAPKRKPPGLFSGLTPPAKPR